MGRVIPQVKCSIAEDGEILVKGPNVMQGYYRKPEDDAEGVHAGDGWFCTGDIGKIDEDGYLIITDRKKELLRPRRGNSSRRRRSKTC